MKINLKSLALDLYDEGWSVPLSEKELKNLSIYLKIRYKKEFTEKELSIIEANLYDIELDRVS